jgi:hypothetical protein
MSRFGRLLPHQWCSTTIRSAVFEWKQCTMSTENVCIHTAASSVWMLEREKWGERDKWWQMWWWLLPIPIYSQILHDVHPVNGPTWFHNCCLVWEWAMHISVNQGVDCVYSLWRLSTLSDLLRLRTAPARGFTPLTYDMKFLMCYFFLSTVYRLLVHVLFVHLFLGGMQC